MGLRKFLMLSIFNQKSSILKDRTQDTLSYVNVILLEGFLQLKNF